MRHKFRYTAGGLGVAVAVLSFIVTLEAGVATPAPSGPRFDPTAVNRSLKGDRLPLIPTTSGANPTQQRETAQPRTCPANHDVFAPEVAGRCIA